MQYNLSPIRGVRKPGYCGNGTVSIVQKINPNP